MKIKIQIVFVLFFCTSVMHAQSSRNRKIVLKNIAADSLNVPLDSTYYYFPINMFVNNNDRNKKLSNFLDRWYSHMLYAMNEPILYNTINNVEVYRFTWLRRFGNPVSLRIEKNDNTIKLYIKQTDGTGGSEPRNIKLNTVKTLTPEQWEIFKTKIENIHFWNMPVEEAKEIDTDNSEWILEGRKNDRYHFVTRTSPHDYNMKFFRNCCEYLLSLSEINTQIKNIH